MASHEIFIPRWRPAGFNELVHCHWQTRARLKKKDRSIVGWMFVNHQKAEGKRRLDIEYVLGRRMRKYDSDNDKKSVLDALVECGALVDDNHKFLEIGETTYSRDWLNWGTKIILTDLE